MLRGIARVLRRVVLLAAVIAGGYWGGYYAPRAYAVYVADYSTTVTIQSDWGGRLDTYIDKYDRWRAHGRYVRIDSFCVSACTLAIGMISPDRLCAGPKAIFGFHSASVGNAFQQIHSVEGTNILWQTYPAELQTLLFKRWNWDGADPVKGDHPAVMYLRGEDVYRFVRPCR